MTERAHDRDPDTAPERAADAAETEATARAAAEASEPTTVEEERDLYLANWQRARADYQNLKRRTLTDIETAVRRARQPLLESMLQILDYLDMALTTKVEGAEARNVLLGVELTRGQLVQLLEQESVRPIPDGGTFDPELHEAVATVPAAGVEPGTVVETVRRGFRWGDRVLRFAQVRVAADPDADAQDSDAEPR